MKFFHSVLILFSLLIFLGVFKAFMLSDGTEGAYNKEIRYDSEIRTF